MWSANLVETLSMSHLTGSEHTFEAVTVAPTCNAEGYTENRCTECGISDGGERTDITEALEHHYITYDDVTYKKDSNGTPYIVSAGVCTICKDSLPVDDNGNLELPEGVKTVHTYDDPEFEWTVAEDGTVSCTATFECEVCFDKNLDCTQDSAKVINCDVEQGEANECVTPYTATCKLLGTTYTDTYEVPIGEGHKYGDEPEYVWADDHSECVAKFTCAKCGNIVEEDCEVTSQITEPTCTEAGKTTYTATFVDGEKTYTNTVEGDKVDALGHTYGEPEFKWSSDHSECNAVFKCISCGKVETVPCEVTPEEDESSITYTAECTMNGHAYSMKVVVTKSLTFTDVPEGSWFYDYVAYVYHRGLMTGMRETKFGPSGNLARAQFAVILYRMEGEPEVTYDEDDVFPDVTADWYKDAVMWGVQNGIITGYTDVGLFRPAKNITREEMAVLMYRYAKYKEKDVSVSGDLSAFPDGSSVSGFAKEAMQWAVANELITGDNGYIRPQNNLNRASCAAIIMRYDQKFGD